MTSGDYQQFFPPPSLSNALPSQRLPLQLAAATYAPSSQGDRFLVWLGRMQVRCSCRHTFTLPSQPERWSLASCATHMPFPAEGA